jgi:hypothetical protein
VADGVVVLGKAVVLDGPLTGSWVDEAILTRTTVGDNDNIALTDR